MDHAWIIEKKSIFFKSLLFRKAKVLFKNVSKFFMFCCLYVFSVELNYFCHYQIFFFLTRSLFPPFISYFTIFLGSDCHRNSKFQWHILMNWDCAYNAKILRTKNSWRLVAGSGIQTQVPTENNFMKWMFVLWASRPRPNIFLYVHNCTSNDQKTIFQLN